MLASLLLATIPPTIAVSYCRPSFWNPCFAPPVVYRHEADIVHVGKIFDAYVEILNICAQDFLFLGICLASFTSERSGHAMQCKT